MAEDMSIESYLAQGGMLSNPANVPPRYRAALLKLMATFVDSELAGAAGFAEVINQGPGIKARIAVAKIVMEKSGNADRVLAIMGTFGADTKRYADHHPWTARLARSADIGQRRSDHDMRLAVFNYPLQGWDDAVVMNLLMGRAVTLQLAEFSLISYQPLAEAFRAVAPVEAHHADLAEKGLAWRIKTNGPAGLQDSIDYWWPRVAASFGTEDSAAFEGLQALGLRRTPNEVLKTRWQAEAGALVTQLGLTPPAA